MSAILISLAALLSTFYQLWLQRDHNEKSLKPLVQIDLMDRGPLIYVHVVNNGVWPLIISKLTFYRDGQSFTNIEECLTLDPRSYQHIPITESIRKILLPGGALEVFSTEGEAEKSNEELTEIQRQLSGLHLKVEGRDIYNNKMSAEREMSWFVRHHDKIS